MLVCNVSLRPARLAIAADIAEAAAALDALTTGQVVFAALVDDPANVQDVVDAYLGEVMLEAATATDSFDAGYALATAIDEAVTAASSQDGTVTAAPAVTTWSPTDKSANVTLTNGNLTVQHSSGTAGGVRSTASKSSGKFYVEYTCVAQGFAAQIGFAIGSGDPAIASSGPCVVVGGFGDIMVNGTTVSGAAIGTINAADVICAAMDVTNSLVWFRRNNGNWNNSASANPATGVDGISVAVLFPTNAVYAFRFATGATDKHTANFGATAFAQTVPSGFVAWNSA
jgi:hypothetical protein